MVVNGELNLLGRHRRRLMGQRLSRKKLFKGRRPLNQFIWRLLPYMVPNRASMSSGALPTSMAAVCW